MEVCLITGTSTGIGHATALHLARNGYKVHATMRNPDKGEALRATAEAGDLPLVVTRCDVTDAASIAETVRAVESADGGIDVLINNAGLSNACPVEIYPEDEHRAMFETNYWGPVRLCQAVLPGMRERGHGAIVNISSILGKVAAVNQAAYCATKFAVEAFSESLAMEVAPFGIRVAIVEPGVVGSQIFDNTPIHYDKASPYRRTMRQSGRFYRTTVPVATPAVEIAATIHQALTADPPRLRWLHGLGDSMVHRRPQISDEDYIALNGLDDDAYDAKFLELFDLDLRPKTN